MARCLLLLGLTACTETTWYAGDTPVGDAPPSTPADRVEVEAHLEVLEIACGDTRTDGPYVRKHSSSPPSLESNWLWGGGVVTGNLLADTLQDLVTPSEPYAQAYVASSSGTFLEDPCLAPFDLTYGTGGSVADFDDDGLLDLLITRFERPTKLLRNLGDSRFEDVTDAVGLTATGPALASTWADFDRDGDLDLFVGNYAAVRSFEARGEGVATGSRLFVSEGGRFTDRSDLLPPEVAAAWVTAAAWVDVDRDGWLDLYVVSDLGTWSGNVLALNHAGALAADGSRFGLDEIMPGSGMAIGDLDGDELPDFVIGERGNLRVMISQPGHWSEESNALGVALAADQVDPWGIEVGDLDNDGELDILAGFGATHTDDPDTAWDQPDAAFVRGSDGLFRDDAAVFGLADTGVTRGVVLADLDSDGSLDIAKRDLEGPNLLYVSECDPAARWLRVQLSSTADNHFAVGARVRVEVDGVVQTRTITAGGIGFGSGGPPEAHFGLGDAATIDVLQVTWPDGRITTVTDVSTSAIVRLARIE